MKTLMAMFIFVALPLAACAGVQPDEQRTQAPQPNTVANTILTPAPSPTSTPTPKPQCRALEGVSKVLDLY